VKPPLPLLCLLLTTLLTPVQADCLRKTLQVGPLTRTGIVCAPHDETRQVPLLLAFHGRGSNGREMAAATGLHEALVVYPDGLAGNPAPHDPQGLRTGWQINVGDRHDRDVAFVDAVLQALARHHHIDRQRVFAVGHSNGARFIGILWAQRGERFAGFAFSAAQADTLIAGAPPRPVFLSMGMADPVVPFTWQRRSSATPPGASGWTPPAWRGRASMPRSAATARS